MTKFAVAGATGRLGRHVVDILETRGYEVVPMSRSLGVDVVTGEGLDEALAGADCIIDVATTPTPDEAAEFFTASSRNLHEAGERAGVRRMVVISIIGIDPFSGGYQAAKQVHERVALAGPLPVRILRAAQFHEFVEELTKWSRQGDTSYLPRMRTQLVAARTVAEVLVDLATAPDSEFPADSASMPILEVAGPREENLVDAAFRLAAVRGEPARVEATSDSSDSDAELLEAGVLLPSPGATLAGPTFEEWLQESTSRAAA
jgi:uncharacterized protein YbjT (DUF2867 family)